MGSHAHSDGIYQKYGVTKTIPALGGEYCNVGGLREHEILLDLTTLTEVETILSDVSLFPKLRFHEVEVITKTAAATGVAFDLGFIREDRTTELDYNGLLAAFPVAQMSVAGEDVIIRQEVTVPASMVGLGALIGTTLANPGYLSASRTTATAFTAGIVLIKIRWYA